MDLQGNDCPCKRQRVSEGDDIDQETGMFIEDASGIQKNESEAEIYCESSETSSNEKGDSFIERETIHKDSFVGATGDFESNFGGDRKQSVINVVNIQSNRNGAQSVENEAGNLTSGFHDNENFTEVKNCSIALNQSPGITQKVQPKSSFCEYVQNVQAIAENSYIRNRERNMSKPHTDTLQKLESPKLKRPIDRVNTNLAKKRSEILPSSNFQREELTGACDKQSKLLAIQSTSVENNLGDVSENECSGEDTKKYSVTKFTNEVNMGMNILENTAGCSNVEAGEGSLKNSASFDINKTKTSCRASKDKGLQGEGFDVSSFVEMFSNSVMGHIMSDPGKTGTSRDIRKHMNEKRNRESLTIKTENIKENLDDSRDVCKFQGLGNLLRDIGASDASSKHSVVNEVVESLYDSTLSRPENSRSSGSHLEINAKSSHLFAEKSDKKESELAETETGDVDKIEEDIELMENSLINGRFKLDFHETQDIVNQGNINRLPVTVIVDILKNLTAFQLLRRASCVCKYWYNLCRDPDIWRSICLVNQHRLSDFDFKRILQFSDYRVRFLNLTDSRFVTNNGIKFLIMSCPLLEELRVMRCFDLTDVAFDGLSSVGVCSNLQALYMTGCCRITDKTVLEVSKACPQLRILNLNQCTRISDTSITGIAQHCPKLTSLQLDHCSQVTDKAMCEIVLGCPEILYLNLMSCGITDTGVKYLAQLKKLSNLDLSNIVRLTSDSVIHLSKFCKNLQCINVSLNTVMDDQCIAELAKNLPLLKRLYCVSCSISDKGLEDIAKYCPNLEALDVGWCQEVSDSGVRVISLACKHLDYFGLIRCDRVTLETIEELVLKYPSINYSTFILESKRLLERARNEGYQFKL